MTKRYAAVLLAPLTLASCGKFTTGSSYPSPVYSAFIAMSDENKDPQCKCDGARGLYISNPDPDYARWARISETLVDTSTGQTTYPTPPLEVVDHGSQHFLGCSIGPYGTNPACKQTTAFEVQSEGRLITGNTFMQAFGLFFTPTAQSCEVACNNPNNPSCINLGAPGKPMVGPMKEMADAAFAADQTIKMADVRAKYGISSTDDKCTRGDIVVTNGIVHNDASGGEICDISSSGVSSMVSGIPESHLILPSQLVLNKMPPNSMAAANDEMHIVYTEDDAHAGQISFSGTGSDSWNKLYSGNIKAIISHPDYAIFATSNGCVRADTK
ncbi:hypothetical protein [Mesorhizobium sp. M0323]|uniref:hypothetical protein n=1 Tax=Mesorhizobium sp. M0323 TaxID=2956938 RepID=UPI003338409A